MKLGFGLYRHQLNQDSYRFARQCGATHLVVHLVDYTNACRPREEGPREANQQPVGRQDGWGRAGDPNDPCWSVEWLEGLKADVEAEGLSIWAIENLDPSMWHDVLLDGPRKDEQMARLAQVVRNVGRAGIPVLGYNFSIAGVCGRDEKPLARGGAMTVVMDGADQTPLPGGMVWNMRCDAAATEGHVGPISHDELWRRLEWFLTRLVPVAEDSGVRLAAHPDDPPTPTLRGTPRLVYQPRMYQRLLDLVPSRANALEYCLGTLSEMSEDDIYEMTDHYSKHGHIAYVHFRNVRGKAPHYHEVFVDEGDIDMPRILGILKKNGFDGVLVPDHTPLMTCDAPWHAGMAYAMGYMRALLSMIG
ncbi:MAG: TIM barrel protein [Rhodopirellula sp.]|nr:TIM barrel protein [Rhodopirellula sp.]